MMKTCDPKDIALKSFFLGPQSENAGWVAGKISEIFEHWYGWRKSLYPDDGLAISLADQEAQEFQKCNESLSHHLKDLISLYEKEVPKFSPRFIGHMVSEVSIPALLGHILNLLHNPNNISSEVSKVGDVLEKEAISALLDMVGYHPKLGQGHFTSGGTVANIEALWRARYTVDHWLALGSYCRTQGTCNKPLFELAHQGWGSYDKIRKELAVGDFELRKLSFVAQSPWSAMKSYEKIFDHGFEGPVVLAPKSKHYSWPKAVSLLGLGEDSFWPIELDHRGRLSVTDLESKIEKARKQQRPIAMVVSVAGTTEMGEIDPVDEVNKLLESYRKEGIHIWHHVDAAYGGFFRTMLGDSKEEQHLEDYCLNALKAIPRADSITIDPHKLGYIPYSCGAILFPDKKRYQVSSFEAPYVDVGNNTWLKTLEGSRSASGAAATWLTAKSIGLDSKGYGRILTKTIEARKQLQSDLNNGIEGIQILPHCDTNIICFCVAQNKEPLSRTNERTLAVLRKINSDGQFMVSKTYLKFNNYNELLFPYVKSWKAEVDEEGTYLLRVVLMNPFFTSKETIDFSQEFMKTLRGILTDPCLGPLSMNESF